MRILVDGDGDPWVEVAPGWFRSLPMIRSGVGSMFSADYIARHHRLAFDSAEIPGEVEDELERVRYDRDCLRDELERVHADERVVADQFLEVFGLALDCLRRKLTP